MRNLCRGSTLECATLALLMMAVLSCRGSMESPDRPEVFPPADLSPDSVVAKVLDFRTTTPSRPDSAAPPPGDPVVGGNGPDWRDLRGGSPRDVPGEAGLIGSVSSLQACSPAPGMSPGCVPMITAESTCRQSGEWDAAGHRSAVEIPQEWFEELMSCSTPPEDGRALPLDVARGISLGAQLVIAPPWPSAGKLECYEAGLAELTKGLDRLEAELGRELFLQIYSPPTQEEKSVELAMLPAELVILPEELGRERQHFVGKMLRARGRRVVLPIGNSPLDSLAIASVTKQLIWGAAAWAQSSPLSPPVQQIIEFARRHQSLFGSAESPVAVALSLRTWTKMSEEERLSSLQRTEATLASLSERGVPYQLAVFPLGSSADSISSSMRNDLANFEVVLLPQSAYSAEEKLLLRQTMKAKPGSVFSVVGDDAEGSRVRTLAPPIRVDELVSLVESNNVGVEWGPGPTTEVSRHAVQRDGGVAFHLLAEDSSPEGRALFVPEPLLGSAGGGWWFHKNGASTPVTGQPITGTDKPGMKFRLPSFERWGILEARPFSGASGSPNPKITSTSDRSVFVRVWGDKTMGEDLGIIVPEVLFPTPVSPSPASESGSEAEFVWTVGEDGRSALFSWPVHPVGVEGRITTELDRIDLAITFTNRSEKAYEKVFSGLCLAPTRNKGFPTRFHDRTWLVGKTRPRSLSEVRVSTGGSPLHVETAQFGWPVIIEESVTRERSIAVAFEHASGVGGNAWGASVCLHIRPTLESLSPGESTTLTGAVYFVDGPVEDAMARLVEEDWGSPRRRFGSVPPASSFRDGLPPHRLAPCAEDEKARLDGPAEP